uniref:CCAAT-binding factor domain-containing protein n=1 Tax=Strombidium rassoulzadegani TaxID=1082188 RepID=A0A7S3CN84_9SPIT|mmetsp:Transcript_17951/g.30540  ORF Transcript_17951/g.30540 Transcript_17951/m.30540 type:complete len:175 (+) Transcript_17951:1059-1583(+)
MRFLRLLDLSLRSPKLPSRLIAAFMKRLSRVMVSYGLAFAENDKMYVISLIANLIKRHPRVVRLIHRKRKIFKENPTLQTDPFRETEANPLKSRAIRSSLWELDILMKQEFDGAVRNYSKLLQGDLHRKTNFFKCDEFTQIDPLTELEFELGNLQFIREAFSVKKHLIKSTATD